MHSSPSPSSTPFSKVPCTYSLAKTRFINQPWYNCYTCEPVSVNKGVCFVCASTCHKGHSLGNKNKEIGISNFNETLFYCDCGDNAYAIPCQCYEPDMIDRALSGKAEKNDLTVDCSMIRAVLSLRQSAIISPTNLKMALELAGSVFNCNDIVNAFIGTKKYTLVSDPCLSVACGVFGVNSSHKMTGQINFDYELREQNGMNIVNSFVEDRTNGLIKNLLSQEPFGITVVSTLYFKGEWESPFDVYQTRKAYEFKGINGTVKVDMMCKYGDKNSKFILSQTLKSLVLPYLGGRFVAVLTLPRDKNSSSRDLNLEEWKSHLNLTNVKDMKIHHYVPKFKKEFDYRNMDQILESAGFDYPRFRAKSQIDEIVHKVVIEFDEKGTKASAATGLQSKGMAQVDEYWEGTVPFMLGVIDLSDMSLLFSGLMDLSC